MESPIQNHPFVDGSKRTGLAAAGILMDLKGYRFAATNEQVFDFAVSVERSDVRREEITRRLEENGEWLEAT
jgi:death on curing protein